MWKKHGGLVTAVVATVLVFVAVPSSLVVAVGLPIPRPWNSSTLLSSTGLFDFLAVVAWIAWFACTRSLLRSVVQRVRQRDAVAAAGARLPDRLAARIAAGILAFLPSAGLLSGVASASGTRSTPAAVVAVSAAMPTATPLSDRPAIDALEGSQHRDAAGDAVLSATLYTVVIGDSLWSIAEHFYGSGSDWEAVALANLGRLMPDGRRFLDPSLILPGWVLLLPGVPVGGPSARVAGASGDRSATPFEPTSGFEAVPPLIEKATATDHEKGQGQLVDASGQHRPDEPEPTRPPTARRARPSGRTPLPELSALGLGVLAAGALTRRLGLVRMANRVESDPTRAPKPPSEQEIDTATLLDRFRFAPLLEWFELANRALTAGLGTNSPRAVVPAVRAIRIGADGCEFILAEAVDWAPAGFMQPCATSWLLSAAADPVELAERLQASQPWLPVVLPVGDDDRSSWLVPVEPGCTVPVVGYGAEAVAKTMILVNGCWDWSSSVVVTDDPVDADSASALLGRDDDHERRRILYLGDPELLSGTARLRCGCLTTLPRRPTDITVAVDARSATIHPLGVTVETNALDEDHQLAVKRLLGAAPRPPLPALLPSVADDDPLAVASPRNDAPMLEDALAVATAVGRWSDRSPGLAAADERLAPHGDPVPDFGPGLIEVRLLTSLPRLDGLSEPLDPKRARRATELVAYLALHRPDQVTSERLRNRVLGSADVDAAAKTLFNTVGAARRAMGVDQAGNPLLPLASRSGRYRVSDHVTTDVERAIRLVRASAASADPGVAMACARAALALVEGEPLAGHLAGYSWWRTEGHESRIANVLVEGAVRLARLASEDGRGALALWAIEQARLVDPYSETLARAAMQSAANLGDGDRLRREWSDCQRRVNELDPGGYPSASTELLFAALSKQLAAHGDRGERLEHSPSPAMPI